MSCGFSSLNIDKYFPVIVGCITENPVMLPPGRAMLATKPLPTGSPTTTNTIGIVCVTLVKCRDDRRAVSDNDIRVKRDQLLRETEHALSIRSCESVLDAEILTDDPPLFCEALLDDFDASLSFLIVR